MEVVKLENEYIEVYILPEIGGKVWGAMDKATGKEFVYKNDVVKFRDIALRGPWTMGGIEWNSGVIGHHAGAATPVNYRSFTDEDGTAHCVVGGMDLPSHMQWRVDISLPAKPHILRPLHLVQCNSLLPALLPLEQYSHQKC